MVFSPAQENNMSTANQLSNAINAFKQWRVTRKKTTHKTPEALQQQVVELLSHYSRGTISNALGLSGPHLSNCQSWKIHQALCRLSYACLMVQNYHCLGRCRPA
jgi:hypothetical protein